MDQIDDRAPKQGPGVLVEVDLHEGRCGPVELSKNGPSHGVPPYLRRCHLPYDDHDPLGHS
jgi:hypothetical protein